MEAISLFLCLALCALFVISYWFIFNKAGAHGWAAIVPVYNLWVLVKVAKLPVWYFIMLLIPYVNFVFTILVHIKLGRVFGKSGGFLVGMALVPVVFCPILAFSNDQYQQEEEED